MRASGRTGIALVAVGSALALTLTACGSGGGSSPGDCDTSRGTLTIGLIAPLSGQLANIGLGMRNAADLAVRQAGERCAVPGYALSLDARDDRGDPPTGAAVARELVADPALVGVVGTYNSATAQAVQPVLAGADVVQISPGNTNVSLTRGANPVDAPLRQYRTYFRVVATDAVQGPAAADHLAGTGATRVAVVSDGGTYGEGIATEFAKQLATRGAQVVLRTTLPAGSPPGSVVEEIVGAAPDAVFYGGEYPDAGPLSRALDGAAGPVMGGDGLVDPGYGPAGGREGDLGTSVGSPPETLPGAQDFVAAYDAAGYPEGYGSYGAPSYDATNVLLGAVGGALEADEEWSVEQRGAVEAGVRSHSGDGVTGPLAFDRFGDVRRETVPVFSLRGGRWTPLDVSS